MIDVQTALLVYLIVLVISYLFSRFFLKINIWSSIVLSAIIALIITAALCPISSIEKAMEGSSATTVYLFIYMITILLGLFYIIERALRDIDYITYRRPRSVTVP